MSDQWWIISGLVVALVLFAWGRWRYDVVALAVLLALTLLGAIPTERTFSGFSHPAVITVAAVLVVSQALRASGLVDVVAGLLSRIHRSTTLQATALTALAALCSAFMNNVGALAILLPVAVQLARGAGKPPSLLLMPLAFGTILGGMCTLIGTPPNIIIATYRAEVLGEPFRMFDFTPVGGAVALAGVAVCGLVGWRLMPKRKPATSREALFEIEEYTAELKVPDSAKAVGMTVRQAAVEVESEITVIGLARGERRLKMPSAHESLAAGDTLIVEADAKTLGIAAERLGLHVEGNPKLREEFLKSDDVAFAEAVVTPGGMVEGRSASGLNLRRRYGLNLLGVARRGRRLRQRLSEIRLRAGDILLLQGERRDMSATLATLGCLPLAERGLRIGAPQRILLALFLLAASIMTIVIGATAVQVALALCACSMVVVRLVSLREAYDAIDWPVIVLLAAMLPIGEGLERTGGAEQAARLLLGSAKHVGPPFALALIMALCMGLTNVVNNAAAAVIAAPIAVNLADGLGCLPDPFLIAAAVGSSAAFLTPIGHQSNTLVMGPAGYGFTDYLRLGPVVSLLTLAVGTAAILCWWPLHPTPP